VDGGISFLLFVDAVGGWSCGDVSRCAFSAGAGLTIFTTDGADADRASSRSLIKTPAGCRRYLFAGLFRRIRSQKKEKQASVKLDARASWGAAVLRP